MINNFQSLCSLTTFAHDLINKSFLLKHFGNSNGSFFKCEPQFLFGQEYDAWPNLAWHGEDSLNYDYQMGYELKSENGWSDLLELIYTLNYDTENWFKDSIPNMKSNPSNYKFSSENIEKLIKERISAKKEKNFELADEIRKTLLEDGVVLEDSFDGTNWRRS